MTPGASPGSSSFYRRPGIALALGLAAVVASALLPSVFRAPAGSVLLGTLLGLLVLSAPALVSVVAARLLAGRSGLLRRMLLDIRWTDLAWGVSVGLLTRAAVEIPLPTTGSLSGGFAAPAPLDVVVIALGVALLTPFVEELLFRGVLAAATDDVARALGPALAAALATAVSTVAFVAVHVFAAGAATLATMLPPLVVGVATGILFLTTRRLAAPIVAHVVFNAIGVGLLLV